MTQITGYNSANWKPRQQSARAIDKTENNEKQEREAMEKWLRAIGREADIYA